ncbi:hypothetical protein [Streptomyces sp. MS2.AVA.5]|uniref:Uncharacterized protein n=1 Tax=Streptomyces achmelvichensis TaxID=3134111 RepID=A0ACC6QA53_9ACTN
MDTLTNGAADILSGHRGSDLTALLTYLADTVAGPAPGGDDALLALRIPLRARQP